jgi:hypothetical protein
LCVDGPSQESRARNVIVLLKSHNGSVLAVKELSAVSARVRLSDGTASRHRRRSD